MNDNSLADWVQYALVVPMMLLWRQIFNHKKEHDRLKEQTVTKDEMKEFVEMSNAPMEVKVDIIFAELQKMSKHLERLADKHGD